MIREWTLELLVALGEHALDQAAPVVADLADRVGVAAATVGGWAEARLAAAARRDPIGRAWSVRLRGEEQPDTCVWCRLRPGGAPGYGGRVCDECTAFVPKPPSPWWDAVPPRERDRVLEELEREQRGAS